MKNFIISLVISVLLFPFFTLIHELGHAVLPVLKGEEVSVSVGENSIINLKLKNLDISIGLSKPWVGYTSWSDENTLSYLLFGPLTSLLLGLIFLKCGSRSNELSAFLYACAGCCLFQFLFTMIPLSYPDWLGYGENFLSDGKKILDLWSKN